VAQGIGLRDQITRFGGLSEHFALNWVLDESKGESQLKMLMTYQGTFNYAGAADDDQFTGSCLLSFDPENNQITTEIAPGADRTPNFTGDTAINFLTDWAQNINSNK